MLRRYVCRPRRSCGKVMFLPPATKLGQGYVFTGVCDSVHGGSTWPGTPPGPGKPPGTRYTPQDQVHPLWTRCTPLPGTRYTPPGTRYTPQLGTPPNQVHLVQSMLGDMVNAWVVRILLKCNLVTPVILFTGGGCLLQCMLAYTHPQAEPPGSPPWADHPPVQTSPEQTPPDKYPPGRHPPGKQPPAKCMLGYTHTPPAQCMLG